MISPGSPGATSSPVSGSTMRTSTPANGAPHVVARLSASSAGSFIAMIPPSSVQP